MPIPRIHVRVPEHVSKAEGLNITLCVRALRSVAHGQI